jgi:hypothetical protein
VMLREKAQGQQAEAESTNALIRVGLLHSSDEVDVMSMERREQVIEIALGQPKGRSLTMQWGGWDPPRWHEPEDARVSHPVL